MPLNYYLVAGGALSAGVILRLPFLRLILCAITAVYLLRGLGGSRALQ